MMDSPATFAGLFSFFGLFDMYPPVLLVCLVSFASCIIVAAWYITYPFLHISIRLKQYNILLSEQQGNENIGLGDLQYDAIIIGAGPAGASAAYFLTKAGKNCLVLEQNTFPTSNCCGDVINNTAAEILNDMGVYKTLITSNKAKLVSTSTWHSPGGKILSVQHDRHNPGALACKRSDLDHALAMAAKRAGADVKDGTRVTGARFCDALGKWRVMVTGRGKAAGVQQTFTATVLVCADGGQSDMAGQLGLPGVRNTLCMSSTAYINNTTTTSGPKPAPQTTDLSVHYDFTLLPALRCVCGRLPDGDINYSIYNDQRVAGADSNTTQQLLIPDSKTFPLEGIRNPVDQGTAMNTGYVRVCDSGIRSYADHMLVVGGAAGMTSPVTGHGVHLALHSGRLAASFLTHVFTVNNYSGRVMKLYQEEWMDEFGTNLRWLRLVSGVWCKVPILLDALIAALQRKGSDKCGRQWCQVISGTSPILALLTRPDILILVAYELLALLVKRITSRA